MKNIDVLKKLIEIPSITDSSRESEPLGLICALLQKEHIKYKIFGKGSKKNLVAEIGKGNKSVLLNSHFDVVPAPRKMFEPRIKNGMVYGRGSADAKGPLVAMLSAFVSLSKQRPPGKVLFCAVSDEENAGQQGTRILVEKGIIADYNIAGEPTNLSIIIAEKGFLRLKIKIFGKELHAAFPDKKSNAIQLAAEAIKKIEKLNFTKSHHLLGKPTVSFGLISGGNKINIGAGYCEIGIDIRYLPSQSQEDLLASIKKVLQPICRFEMKITGSGIPFETSPNSRLVKIAQEVSHGKIQGVNFGTDARFYALKEAIVLGPGKSDIAHQEKEYIALRDIEKAAKYYAEIVSRVLSESAL